MKHFSRLLFTAAVLLVSLMIYDGQKCGNSSQRSEKPDFKSIELQAEVCFPQSAGSSLPGCLQQPGVTLKRNPEHINNPACKVRLNIQMQIHQEIKAGLDVKSGREYRHHRPPEDPLIT